MNSVFDRDEEMPTLQERKALERKVYEEQYAANKENAPRDIREEFLWESEEAFINLVRKRCEGKRVLEIGCGAGQHSLIAARAGAREVIGIDISEEGIKLATQNAFREGVADRVRFSVMDIEKLEFPDGYFDVVLNHEAFSSIDIGEALPELARVLKSGGIFIGIESLGHNPIFNLNRTLGFLRGRRTRWAVTHIMKISDHESAQAFFRTTRAEYFHILTPLAFLTRVIPFSGLRRRVVELCGRADRYLLQKKLFQPLAFKIVFEWER